MELAISTFLANPYRNRLSPVSYTHLYTQAELARLLQIDRTHMGNMELAATGTSLDLLFRLSDALEIPVYKLFLFRD